MSELFSQSSSPNNSTQLASKTKAKQFLRFNLAQDTPAMLSIAQITEVLKIQFDRIVPIPQMPGWTMGVYNWRGDILWMLDLGDLLGLGSWYQQELNYSNHTAIVLSPNKEKTKNSNAANIHLGLVVPRVEDIEMCNLDAIQAPSSSTETTQLSQFLQGYWLKPEGDMILVLDGEAIVAAMPQNSTN